MSGHVNHWHCLDCVELSGDDLKAHLRRIDHTRPVYEVGSPLRSGHILITNDSGASESVLNCEGES